MPRPAAQESAEFYHKYISYTSGNSVAEILTNHSAAIKTFYNNLPESKSDYAYAAGKWTIKEVLQHIIDAERVFAYRALRIARKDTTPLAGFDENAYAETSNASARSLQSLKDEFNALRASSDIMLSTFKEDQLAFTGTASNKSITANALCYILIGHLLHHKAILEERYSL